MKKIFLPVLVLAAAFTACGPAAENREQMMARSKVFQDSIANAIKVSMAEASAPGPNVPAPAPTATPATTAAAQPATPANQTK